MKRLAPDPDGIAEAAEALRRGAIVAYPTETVYGLAVDPFQEDALRRLFAAKQRDPQHPILLIIADESQLPPVVARVSPRAHAYARAFWPGPLSLVLPKAPGLSALAAAGTDTICVRCPGSPIARDLCRRFGAALTSTSANLSGEPAARSLDEIRLPGIELGLDGGLLPESAPSTVFDPETGQLYREGAIPVARLQSVPHE
ncbi:MAG: threonylcarbamoyl-AMP synthase [Candidatus Hydrogenedentes bacterium]|nr:threonylcarbamoyl-AMP synthase [Candidatus Hydrogenedentota bacterium]